MTVLLLLLLCHIPIKFYGYIHRMKSILHSEICSLTWAPGKTLPTIAELYLS